MMKSYTRNSLAQNSLSLGIEENLENTRFFDKTEKVYGTEVTKNKYLNNKYLEDKKKNWAKNLTVKFIIVLYTRKFGETIFLFGK